MNKERKLIEQFFVPLSSKRESLQLKNDAACITKNKKSLIISSDMMVQDIHFDVNDCSFLLAKKLLRVNLSDMAAMGSDPYGYMLNIAIPSKLTGNWLKKFCNGLKEDQKLYNIKLFGGDFSSSEKIFLSITIFGKKNSKIHRLDNANESSDIYVSGTIGDSVFGFLFKNDKENKIKKKMSLGSLKYLHERYSLPQPRVALSKKILKYSDSCTDISDGLVPDLDKISKYSMIGSDIFLNKIPLSEPLKKVFNLFSNKKKFWNFVLGGGEDYELIFSVPSKKKKSFKKNNFLNPKLTKIGRFTKEKRMKIYDLNFKSLKFKKIGYSHF